MPKAFVRPTLDEVRGMFRAGVDGIVLALMSSPDPLLPILLKYLRPGFPFVVYCMHQEPLTKLYVKLRTQKPARVIDLKLHDNWYREYQILPERTHPMMQMSSTGGYLLSGYRIKEDPGDRPAVKGDVERKKKKVPTAWPLV
eukprot:TRINITY_DN2317_c0_g1_i1.p2 TRINITY_DN2317_c0_g1~~TRINITY_DN2317_c0_g1_i1.p2  ORF type:complete len:142 (+),score=26.97 TRINITY_DN2317_c0_g1_i1:194-619(+)